MSKSYYKYPSVKDYSRDHSRWAKRQASKAVRRKLDIGNGAQYKKHYCSYDIFDYKSTYYTDQQVIDSWYVDKKYKIPKKSLVKVFRKISIRDIMDIDL